MPPKLPSADRRIKNRLPIVLEVHLSWRGGDFKAVSVDLAESGIFVQTRQTLSHDTQVRASFRVSGRSRGLVSVVADGRVRRAVSAGGEPGIAIRFERFIEGRQAVRELIHDRVGRGASPAEPAKGDRRRATRLSVGLPVYWGTTSPPRTAGFLCDISETGAFVLETDSPAAVGDRIFVKLELPLRNSVEHVKAIARVVRRQTEATLPCGMGIEFEYSSVDTALIRRFVAQQNALESMRKHR